MRSEITQLQFQKQIQVYRHQPLKGRVKILHGRMISNLRSTTRLLLSSKRKSLPFVMPWDPFQKQMKAVPVWLCPSAPTLEMHSNIQTSNHQHQELTEIYSQRRSFFFHWQVIHGIMASQPKFFHQNCATHPLVHGRWYPPRHPQCEPGSCHHHHTHIQKEKKKGKKEKEMQLALWIRWKDSRT